MHARAYSCAREIQITLLNISRIRSLLCTFKYHYVNKLMETSSSTGIMIPDVEAAFSGDWSSFRAVFGPAGLH